MYLSSVRRLQVKELAFNIQLREFVVYINPIQTCLMWDNAHWVIQLKLRYFCHLLGVICGLGIQVPVIWMAVLYRVLLLSKWLINHAVYQWGTHEYLYRQNCQVNSTHELWVCIAASTRKWMYAAMMNFHVYVSCVSYIFGIHSSDNLDAIEFQVFAK